MTDPDGHTTTYTYDADGDVLTKEDALSKTWTYTYNSLGEVLTSQTPDQAAAGAETTNTYDADGNLLSTSAPLPGGGSATTTYTYGTGCTTSGNPCYIGDVDAVTDPDGNTTSYTYDTYGDLASATGPLANKTTYTYNALGQRTSMVSPKGNATPSLVPGDIYTLAGSADGAHGYSGDGGAATSALLGHVDDVVADAAGDLYIADTSNNRVQELAATTHTQWGTAMTAGDIYTIAGSASGTSGSSGDGGAATSALLSAPTGVALDSSGDLFIADQANNRAQEVAATTHTQWGIAMTAGDIYTVAGTGTAGHSGDGGAATAAHLDLPTGVALDPAGDLYIADQYNNRAQEVAAATGTQRGQSMTAGDIYTVAGSASGADGYSGDGGAATSALLNGPDAIAVDPAGDLYIADTANNRAQFVAAATCSSSCPSGLSSTTANDIYTVAGSASGASGSSGDGGAATSALLSGPAGVALDPAGDLYIADTNNNRAQFVAATTCSSSCPWGLSSTTAGHIYTIAGSAAGGSGESGQRGPATSALLEAPAEVALDPSGNLLVADTYNYEVQLVAASTCSSGCSWGPFVTTAAHVYTVAGSVLATGGHSGDAAPATSALLGEVGDVVADRFGNLYIADTSNNRVQEVAATTHTQWGIAMTAGDIYTVAGSASGTAGSSGDGGPATSALLSSPTGVALDAAGDLYIADQANNRPRKWPPLPIPSGA